MPNVVRNPRKGYHLRVLHSKRANLSPDTSPISKKKKKTTPETYATPSPSPGTTELPNPTDTSPGALNTPNQTIQKERARPQAASVPVDVETRKKAEMKQSGIPPILHNGKAYLKMWAMIYGDPEEQEKSFWEDLGDMVNGKGEFVQ